jgi:hypothetical protein
MVLVSRCVAVMRLAAFAIQTPRHHNKGKPPDSIDSRQLYQRSDLLSPIDPACHTAAGHACNHTHQAISHS